MIVAVTNPYLRQELVPAPSASQGAPCPNEERTPDERREASYARWRSLPESFTSAPASPLESAAVTAKDPAGNHAGGRRRPQFTAEQRARFKALPADASVRLGATQVQRSVQLAKAAERGDVPHLKRVLEAGADVAAVDEYGLSPLHLAAWHGHMEAVRELLQWGAPAAAVAHGGSTPGSIAAANEDAEILALLQAEARTEGPLPCGGPCLQAEARTEGPLPRGGPCLQAEARTEGPLPRGGPCLQAERKATTDGGAHDTRAPLPAHPSHPKVVSVVAPTCSHLCAGSFYIDNGFSEETLATLEALHVALPRNPAAPQKGSAVRSSQAERTFYCDAEGWVRAAIEGVLGRATWPIGVDDGGIELPGKPKVALPYMRFLCYSEVGGELAPHVDLSKKNPSTGRSSTYTFLLYLTTCEHGGETLLLDSLAPVENKHSKSSLSLARSDMMKMVSSSDEHQEVFPDVCCGQVNGIDVRAAVKPVRGRLFVFPHVCPHAGQRVECVPKLIVRGELY
ncbi:hypothetical protein CYMTET_32195 [Cymbomonas tetramitiformis]|uniref:Prolyl 4-hydroxylase alpha subunit domain-containing protein n=1 Tax=Cymbomonas tetramitiformis TaxID=36881 RepID=A0AAE0FF94_9CHLO|nr:hypothetical protein CYMTET_32195 [Cymbomonas tetramitiformis]